jgi:GAF domain-containing protein
MVAPDARGEAVQRAVAEATERLLGDEPWQHHLGDVLALVGEALAVDRVYVFRNRRGPDGRLWMDLQAEWKAPGIAPIFADPRNHLHPYYPDFARWIELLGSGEMLHAKVRDLPEEERRVLTSEHVVALLAVPVFLGEEWWGFVTVDDCRGERDWQLEETDAVRAVAGALSSAVRGERSEEDRRIHEERYQVLVEQGPVVTYIDAVDETASTLFISPQVEASG